MHTQNVSAIDEKCYILITRTRRKYEGKKARSRTNGGPLAPENEDVLGIRSIGLRGTSLSFNSFVRESLSRLVQVFTRYILVFPYRDHDAGYSQP